MCRPLRVSPLQGRLRKHLTLDVSDVLVDGPIPSDSEDIAIPVGADVFKEPNVAPQFEKMILHEGINFLCPEVRLQFLSRLQSETK